MRWTAPPGSRPPENGLAANYRDLMSDLVLAMGLIWRWRAIRMRLLESASMQVPITQACPY